VNDARATGFGDRRAVPARLGRDGQRRVRVAAVEESTVATNLWTTVTAFADQPKCEAEVATPLYS